MKTIIAFALFVLAGCVTTDKYHQTLVTWNDETVAHLKAKWGEPTRIVDHEQNKILIYNRRGVSRTTCETQFLVNDQKILGWRGDGHGCVMSPTEAAKLSAESSTWNTKETEANRPKETSCASSRFGSATFTNCTEH